jgi:hypothetical protein
MTGRLISVSALIVASAMFASAAARSEEEGSRGLTVHEWGTFTAIAGRDGRPVQWLPLGGPEDLPCFVERVPNLGKSTLWATVRMETPVLYFYGPTEATVDVQVRFPLGLMTELFPAAHVRGGTIAWNGVRVAPGGSANFPLEPGSSHYYAARATDAAPVQLGRQTERFLFYRGVGSFPLPIAATVDASGHVTVNTLTRHPLGQVVLFENRGETIGYTLAELGAGTMRLASPSAGTTLDALTSELERMLTGRGLFPKEAAAMVATWRDSWFERGTRLFYVMPESAVDSILPLRITPQPAHTARVFVGRMEIVTPSLEQEVSAAARANDWRGLSRHARFLHAIGDRIAAGSAPDRVLIQQRIRSAAAAFSVQASSSSCLR